ncbi:hypothetical protein ACN28S_54580 [Cystobacter fuscus]
MNFNLIDIYHHMGLFARCIAYTLVAFALASLIVFFERLFFLFRTKGADRAFIAKGGRMLEAQQHEAFVIEPPRRARAAWRSSWVAG